MKKKLLFAAVLLAVAACNKQAPDTHLVAVRFDYTTAGNFPTKGIADAIASTLPASLDLTLTDTDGNTWTATTGQTIRLPVGTYSVTGGNEPPVVQQITSSGFRYTTHQPIVKVEDTITIEEGVTQYFVDAFYQSFAVGVLPSEVIVWEATFKGSVDDVDCIKTDDLWLVFVTGNLTGASCFAPVLTTPAGKVKQFSIYTNPADANAGGIMAEYGKWYILHPEAYQSGLLGLNLPIWTEGLD